MNDAAEKQDPGTLLRKWSALVDLLQELGDLEFGFFDPSGRRLAQTAITLPVCRLIRSYEAGCKACEECWKDIVPRVGNDDVQVHHCRARLANLVGPVRIGPQLVGYLVGGVARLEAKQSTEEAEEAVRAFATETGIPPADLLEAYRGVPALTPAALEERRKGFKRLIRILSQAAADASLVQLVAELQAAGEQGGTPAFWQTLGQVVGQLVSAARVEVFTVAPALDCAVQVWPAAPEPPFGIPAQELERLAKGEQVRGADAGLLVPVRSRHTLVAVLRAQAPPGTAYAQTDTAQLCKLADAAGEMVASLRARAAEDAMADLCKRLAPVKDHDEKLRLILQACAELLDCDTGDVSLKADDSPGWLRVVARYGEAAKSIPYFVPDDVGITGRVIRTKAIAVVPRIAGDADFKEAMLDTGRLSVRYCDDHWRRYKSLLSQLCGCVKYPLIVDGEVVGVMCLHRARKGVFDMDKVHVLKRLVDRAVVEAACVSAAEQSATVLLSHMESPSGLEDLVSGFSHLTPADARHALGRELAEKAMAMSGAYRTAVRVISPDSTSLGVIATAEREKESWPPEFREPTPLDVDCAATWAFKTGESYLIEDTAEKGKHYVAVPPEAKCHASILLKFGAQALGILALDWDTAGAISMGMVRAFEALGGTYAAAINRFGAEELFRRLETSLQSRKGPLTSDEYHDFLKAVADMVGTHQGAMFIRRADTGRYHLVAHLVYPEWSGDDHWYESGEGVTGWIAANNRPLLIANLSDKEELKRIDNTLEWKNMHSDGPDRNYAYLGVPIAVGSEVLGVLRLASPGRGQFSGNDLQIALATASRVAGRLYQVEEDRRTQALREFSAHIATLTSQRELAGCVFTALEGGLADCACHIRILDRIQEESGQVVDVLSRLAVSDKRWESTPWYRRIGVGIAGRVWQSRKPLVYEDVKKDPWIRQVMDEDLAAKGLLRGVGSGACTPIFSGNTFVGTLHVHKRYRRALSPRDIEFFEEVARLAGPALEAAGKREQEELQLQLGAAIDGFLVGLLRGTPLRQAEADLLGRTLEALQTSLRGRIGWVRVPDDTQANFTVIHAEGIDKTAVPVLSIEEVMNALGPNHFLVVVDSRKDQRLAQFMKGKRKEYQEAVRTSHGCAICMVREEHPLALFTLLVEPPGRISYTRVEQATIMLGQIAELIMLGRQFELHGKDIRVILPLALLGSMVSGFEHQVLGPLSRLKLAIEFLTARPRTPEQVSDKLQSMEVDRTQVESCLQDIRSLVRGWRQDFAPLDIVELLRQVITREDHGTDGPRLSVLPPAQSLSVMGHKEYLQTAFQLLVKNALEAVAKLGSAGRVTVKIRRTGRGQCVVSVEDNGVGMSEEIGQRVFEPFFTTKITGTGMGLSAAYCIMRCHDGEMRIEKREPNRGTRVNVYLPLSKGN